MNHFPLLYGAAVLPISENKFKAIVNLALHTGAAILQNQYTGEYSFEKGLACFDRVILEKVFGVLRKARLVHAY